MTLDSLYEPLGVHFVPLKEHPTEVHHVTDIAACLREFAPEFRWAKDVLARYNGHGIALPQLGVPVNAAVLRHGTGIGVVFNLEIKPDITKGKRTALEADYSVMRAEHRYAARRWKKIVATWQDEKGKKFTRVMRSPKSPTEVPLCNVLQVLDSHMGEFSSRLVASLDHRYHDTTNDVLCFLTVQLSSTEGEQGEHDVQS